MKDNDFLPMKDLAAQEQEHTVNMLTINVETHLSQATTTLNTAGAPPNDDEVQSHSSVPDCADTRDADPSENGAGETAYFATATEITAQIAEADQTDLGDVAMDAPVNAGADNVDDATCVAENLNPQLCAEDKSNQEKASEQSWGEGLFLLRDDPPSCAPEHSASVNDNAAAAPRVTDKKRRQRLRALRRNATPGDYVRIPLPSIQKVVLDLYPMAQPCLVIGNLEQTLFNATHLVPDINTVEAAKAVPNGSKNDVQRRLRSGVGLSRDHLIEGGRTYRYLPDLRGGAPTMNAAEIVVIQPHHYDQRDLVAYLEMTAAVGARVTFVGYDPFFVTDEIDRITLPLLKGLRGLSTNADRHFYHRFEKLPLRMENDPAFDRQKQQYGSATWRCADALAYVAALPSMKRLARTSEPAVFADNFKQLREAAALSGLKKAWGGASKKRVVTFPLIVRSGFINL